MNQFYDNHANNIEYFNIHNKKPKQKKREFVDLSLISNDELFELHVETKIKLEDVTEVYKLTKSEFVLEKLNRISRFRTAIRVAMKKRKVLTYSEYNLKLATLEAKLKSNTAIANNDSELKKYKKLYEDQLKSNVAIKEVERTKRCELNVMRELNIHREFKLLIKEHIGDDAYLRLIKTASDLVDE